MTDEGFTPAVIVVQRDLPIYWSIDNRMTDAGLGTGLLAPYYPAQLLLGPGENLLSLYPSESFDAVSYTHLDVYKRQMSVKPAAEGSMTKTLEIEGMMLSLIHI